MKSQLITFFLGNGIIDNDNFETAEEVKLEAVKTVQAVFKSASLEVIQELFSEAQKPLFSHLSFTLLKTAAFQEMKDLKYFLFVILASTKNTYNYFILGLLLWIV